MIGTVYGWRSGSRVKIDASKAGRELARIEKKEGALTPEAVLAQARSSNSALHDHFTWDDTEAAEQYRLGQAGELIRSITVDITHSNVEPTKAVRAFVSVTDTSGRSYVNTARAMSDTEMRQQVLQRAWVELSQFRKKYGELQELAAVFAAMDRARPAA